MKPWVIGCQNQDRLTEDVVNGLLHDRFSCCWNVVVPPGFSETLLAEAIEKRLRGHPAMALVAAITVDEVGGDWAFLGQLRRHWIDPAAREEDLVANAGQADVALDRLLAEAYRKAGSQPVVLFLNRFHKFLDILGAPLLSKLRTEENAYRLRTATLTHLPYEEMKQRWARKHGTRTVSAYGDTHSQAMADPLTPDSVERLAGDEGIPAAVAEVFWQLTGGYPEPLREVIAAWMRGGHRTLDRAARGRLERVAIERLTRFVEWLDPEEDRRFRDHLINLHLDPDDQEAYEVLRTHPWKDALLLPDGLRAEALGAAALAAGRRDALTRRPVNTVWRDAVDRARLLYGRRLYDDACQLLGAAAVREGSPASLWEVHARVMRELYGGEEEQSAEDVDWRGLRQALRQARDFLGLYGAALDPVERARLADRYQELDELAEKVRAAASVQGPYQDRLVDVLAGLAGTELRSPKHAVVLLWLKYETARVIPGPSKALREALELPEQLLRVWAFWRLGLNADAAPPGRDEVWEAIERDWGRDEGTQGVKVERPAPGERFRSLRSFLCFARACCRAGGNTTPAEDTALAKMLTDLSFYEPIRNGKAHAWTATPEKHRRKYFELIERWLGLVLTAYPDPDPISETSLQMLLEPLPLLDW